jgi:5-formyltetrahydrofolate cyclo-ligase
MNEPIPAPATKADGRRWARERRATLDLAALSGQLGARLTALPLWDAAQHVLLYAAMPDEVDPLPLAALADKRFYLPRCAPNRRLAVHAFVPGETPLRAGPFGIREPDPRHVPEHTPDVLDLVVVPSVLLSERCERLGYGGGYYDRFLPRLSPGCATVGLCPDSLLVPALPTEPHDIRLDIVLTETRFFCKG